jgi:hypothetical protein
VSPRFSYFIRLAISLAIVGFVVSRTDWKQKLVLAQAANIGMLVLAFVLLWVERIWAIIKWYYLLHA